MIKKIFAIFGRDIRVNTRDFLSLYIMVVPVIFAVLINLLAPGVNDTTVNLAMIEGENPEMVAYMEDFAKVTVYKDLEALEERVNRRDDVFAYIANDEGYYILQQGNELGAYVDYAKILLAFYEEGTSIEETTAHIIDFGRTVPPLKKMLVNIAVMFTSIMGGMLIDINIIEEKVDKTIRAMRLTPISLNGFIVGKGIMGMFLPVIGAAVLIIGTGFRGINWGQMTLVVVVSSIISMLVGYLMGLTSETFMDAAGSVKMLFLPLGAAVAVAELAPNWVWTVYWVPFYWTYLATDDILAYTSSWSFTLMASGIVLVLSSLVYLATMPKIKKGLL